MGQGQNAHAEGRPIGVGTQTRLLSNQVSLSESLGLSEPRRPHLPPRDLTGSL